MYTLKIIRHSDITIDELDEVIKIKSVAWPYPYNKQLEWVQQNLKKTDLHLLLLKNNEAVAYLNLIDIEIEIDGNLVDGFGIGNVCAFEKGKGYGNELMIKTKQYIIQEEKVGLLFCKKELVDFYKKHNWIWVDKNKLKLKFDYSKIETMTLAQFNTIVKLTFNGQPF